MQEDQRLRTDRTPDRTNRREAPRAAAAAHSPGASQFCNRTHRTAASRRSPRPSCRQRTPAGGKTFQVVSRPRVNAHRIARPTARDRPAQARQAVHACVHVRGRRCAGPRTSSPSDASDASSAAGEHLEAAVLASCFCAFAGRPAAGPGRGLVARAKACIVFPPTGSALCSLKSALRAGLEAE